MRLEPGIKVKVDFEPYFCKNTIYTISKVYRGSNNTSRIEFCDSGGMVCDYKHIVPIGKLSQLLYKKDI